MLEAFDLRNLDRFPVLSSKNRNATSFFSGRRIGPDSERDIWNESARALLEADRFPPVLRADDLLPFLGESVGSLRNAPAHHLLGLVLAQYGAHWDGIVGSLRALSPPISSQRLAYTAVLRLVVIDAAVRLTALLWLTRYPDDAALPTAWCRPKGLSSWLRSLVKGRDDVANSVRVRPQTVDDWLDHDVRPNDENLQDLAAALRDDDGERRELLRHLRLAYGMRDMFALTERFVGAEYASGLATRLTSYAVQMLRFIRTSEKTMAENDTIMRLTLLAGATGGRSGFPWISFMIRQPWKDEPDPVWRTTIMAMQRGWQEHLLEVACRLVPSNESELRQVFGSVPPPEALEAAAYLSMASKEELARDPVMAAAMNSEIAEGGRFGALELKLRAQEADNQGNYVRAVELIRLAIDQDPGNAEMHYRLGCYLWSELFDVDGGLAELEISAQLDPGWDKAHVDIAIVLSNIGRDEEALVRLERSEPLLREPSNWHLLQTAHLNERLGRADRAVSLYEQLIERDTTQAEAMDRLAHLYFVLGDKRKGAAMAKRAAHLGFTTVLIAWERGYYDDGKPKARPPHTVPEHLLQFSDRPWAGAAIHAARSTSRRDE